MPCVQSLISGTSDGEKIYLEGSSPFADNLADADGDGDGDGRAAGRAGRIFWAKFRLRGLCTG